MTIANSDAPFSIHGRAIFHYNVPVADLDEAKSFYGGVLGCREVVARKRSDSRTDYDFFGNHLIIKEVDAELADLQREAASHTLVRHFGAFLPWPEFGAIRQRLEASRFKHRLIPADLPPDGPAKEACIFVTDPSGNTMEFKTAEDIVEWLA